MPDDPISPPATPPAAEPPLLPAATTPSSRRPLVWVALGAAALGVAGGGAAAVALSGDSGPARVAVTAAADDETTPPADAEGDAAGAECAPGEHRRPGAHGTVTGVDGTTVTIEDDEGTATTVTTDDETNVLDVAEGDVADIAEGDTVVVMGETGDDEGVTARHVTDLGTLDPEALHPGGPRMGRDGAEAAPDEAPGDEATPPEGERRGDWRMGPTTGTVASVDGGTFTVTTDDGDVAVTTTDETAVTVVTEIAVADLAEGDTVAARGETDDEGTVAADVIIRGELEGGRPGFGPGLGGPGGPGGHGPGRWDHDGERPDGPPTDAPDPDAPEAPDDEGTTTTTEA